ncbi:MAG TPA: RIP metalloprotease RseP [Candidatus Moranbacteria bacterium]|nr:RIP metalloprotease RseP [Candidatus Moranbacteria bacterium]
MLTFIVFLAVLSVLVLVHELGHFLVARKSGVWCDEFGFGFPPRVIGIYKNKSGKWKIIWGGKEVTSEEKDPEDTIYSINLIPLGGFVKIHGEDGQDKLNKHSFASQPIYKRFMILAAGVTMNFLLAVVLFTFAFWMGLPEVIDSSNGGEFEETAIQISAINPKSPAQEAKLQLGDEVISVANSAGIIAQEIQNIEQLQEIIKENKGNELILGIIHPGERQVSEVKVTPRIETPEGEGPLGVGLVEVAFVKHGFFESLKMGIQATIGMVIAIFIFLWDLLKGLFIGQSVGQEVAGPVGIAVMTGQVARMGLAFILQFAAMLSVNLAVINFLPLPALDGGRVIFLLIEKIKGKPVDQKIEGIVHGIGFMLLMLLMLLVTVKDFSNFGILSKIGGLF